MVDRRNLQEKCWLNLRRERTCLCNQYEVQENFWICVHIKQRVVHDFSDTCRETGLNFMNWYLHEELVGESVAQLINIFHLMQCEVISPCKERSFAEYHTKAVESRLQIKPPFYLEHPIFLQPKPTFSKYKCVRAAESKDFCARWHYLC
jgi:hypothetical protein